jgi:hypothetical protein
VIDPSVEAKIEVILDDLAGDVADVLVANAGVVRTLRGRIAYRRKAERTAIFVEEVLLLEAESRAGIVKMVARLFEVCGVLPSGIMTSHMTRTPLVRALSG